MWSRSFTLLAVFSLLAIPVGTLRAEPHFKTLRGTLLLRNGEVLDGWATRQGDRFVVRLEGSGQVRIPVADVEFFGRDIQQVYRYRLAQILPDQTDQYIELAQWCLVQGLLREAALCVLQVSRVDPEHAALEPLEERLLQAVPSGGRLAEVHSPPAPEQDASTEPAVVDVAPNALAEFSRGIQPILLNGCTTAACHRGTNEVGYRLYLPLPRWPLGRRLTLKNLRATLPWIDVAAPDQSRLLTQAITPHGAPGNRKSRSLGRAQYQRLESWVRMVAEASADRTGSAREPTPDSTHRTVSAELPVDSGRTAVIPPPEPHDPFDPSIFNRQFRPSESPSRDPVEKTGEDGVPRPQVLPDR